MYQDALDATFKATLEKHAASLEKKAFLGTLAAAGKAAWNGMRIGASGLKAGMATRPAGFMNAVKEPFMQTGAGLSNIGTGMKHIFSGNFVRGASHLGAGMVQAAPAAAVGGGALYGANRMGHASGVSQEQNKPMMQRAFGA